MRPKTAPGNSQVVAAGAHPQGWRLLRAAIRLPEWPSGNRQAIAASERYCRGYVKPALRQNQRVWFPPIVSVF